MSAEEPAETVASTEPPAPVPASETEISLVNLTIFVVDDEPDTNDLIALFLQLKGATVRQCFDAQSALDALEKGLVPDLILSDCKMPPMHGPEFVARIRASTNPAIRGIPVVFVSSMTEGSLYTGMCEIGCPIVTKPLELEELLSCVQRVLQPDP